MVTCTFEDGGKGFLRHVVVDALVIQKDTILLVKRADTLSEGGKWALPGGFADRDETTQKAVTREVLEETGYEIHNPILFTIRDNPNRPHEDRQNVAFVFIAQAGEKIGESDWESSDVQWFALEKLPEKESIAFDHFDDIQLYLEYKKKNLPIPILSPTS